MSDDKAKAQTDNVQEGAVQAQSMPITIHAQYVRDISFENPDAPLSIRAGQAMPVMDVNIGMDTRKLEDDAVKNLYEVALTLSSTAMRDEKPVFIAEVIYGVTVSIGEEVAEEQHHPILLIEVPRMAFPFARQVLATIVSQGGYPPLLLNPVDFHALYLDRFKDEIKQNANSTEDTAAKG